MNRLHRTLLILLATDASYQGMLTGSEDPYQCDDLTISDGSDNIW